jgi:hypothetical protein
LIDTSLPPPYLPTYLPPYLLLYLPTYFTYPYITSLVSVSRVHHFSPHWLPLVSLSSLSPCLSKLDQLSQKEEEKFKLNITKKKKKKASKFIKVILKARKSSLALANYLSRQSQAKPLQKITTQRHSLGRQAQARSSYFLIKFLF